MSVHQRLRKNNVRLRGLLLLLSTLVHILRNPGALLLVRRFLRLQLTPGDVFIIAANREIEHLDLIVVIKNCLQGTVYEELSEVRTLCFTN